MVICFSYMQMYILKNFVISCRSFTTCLLNGYLIFEVLFHVNKHLFLFFITLKCFKYSHQQSTHHLGLMIVDILLCLLQIGECNVTHMVGGNLLTFSDILNLPSFPEVQIFDPYFNSLLYMSITIYTVALCIFKCALLILSVYIFLYILLFLLIMFLICVNICASHLFYSTYSI